MGNARTKSPDLDVFYLFDGPTSQTSTTVSNAPAHAEQLLEKLNRGQSTINEARHDLGLAPVEGGDMRLIKRD